MFSKALKNVLSLAIIGGLISLSTLLPTNEAAVAATLAKSYITQCADVRYEHKMIDGVCYLITYCDDVIIQIEPELDSSYCP